MSSLSFQPANPAMVRPSDLNRASNPFAPRQPFAPTPALNAAPFQVPHGQTYTQFSFASATPASSSAPNATQQPSAKYIAPPQNPAEASDGKDASKDKDKKPVGPLGFVFPVMTLIGTPIMLVTSMLGINKNKKNELAFNPNWFSKQVFGLGKDKQGNLTYKAKWVPSRLKNVSADEAKNALERTLLTNYKAGRLILALGIIPKSLIGIMYGIQAQQPSILLAHLLQLPLLGMIIKENKIATTWVYLMGGLFTLGFINDTQNGHIKDKLPGSEHEKTRLYDMTRFKQAFDPHSGLPLGTRLSQAVSEFGKMLKFSGEDHVISSKRSFEEVKKLIHGDKNELTDLKTAGSISKSSLGFMLSYAATIPALVGAAFIKEDSKIAGKLSKYSMGTTLLSGIMLNFGMMLVALSGKNWAERVPMAGTSMELSGTVMGYSTKPLIQPIALALQQLGGGLNSIFFASKAQKD